MAGGFEEPERGERTGDGADGVHEAFQTEGAAVSSRWHIGGEQRFLSGRADAASQPRGDAAEEHMVGMGCKRERCCRESGEGIAKDGKRLAMLQAIGVVACGEFGEAREAVGDAFDGAKPGGTCADGCEKRG